MLVALDTCRAKVLQQLQSQMPRSAVRACLSHCSWHLSCGLAALAVAHDALQHKFMRTAASAEAQRCACRHVVVLRPAPGACGRAAALRRAVLSGAVPCTTRRIG